MKLNQYNTFIGGELSYPARDGRVPLGASGTG